MTRRAGKLPLIATVTVSLWTAGLVLAYLLELGTLQELLWACWAASLLLVPIVIVDSRHTGAFSWPVLVGLLLPGLNLLVGTAYALSQFRRRHGQPNDRHGLLFFAGVFTAALAVVVTPYVLGPIALLCGLLVRRQYSTREGALLLTVGGVTTLFGLALNVVVFLFVRPGPVA
ncbi:hypothetical protein EGH21_20570 [Halomicroarcula sp. F13]|uniref:Small multi-drug export protein n=1 Tax=Haloarcula rubra TaxID=2487747 RepID=A0AAW4PY37_9EURY|nr:hypothetical protein [Halomicroarcula rubra]MBX0325425.1 hypothetical protein [Halomicroarcula rubra]